MGEGQKQVMFVFVGAMNLTKWYILVHLNGPNNSHFQGYIVLVCLCEADK